MPGYELESPGLTGPDLPTPIIFPFLAAFIGCQARDSPVADFDPLATAEASGTQQDPVKPGCQVILPSYEQESPVEATVLWVSLMG